LQYIIITQNNSSSLLLYPNQTQQHFCSIVPPTDVPSEDFTQDIATCRANFNSIMNGNITPSMDAYKPFTAELKRLMRYRQSNINAVAVMREVKILIRERQRLNRNLGNRQIDVIYILLLFRHHHLSHHDVNDMLGLSNSWAGFY
jgi:hypothetical protein